MRRLPRWTAPLAAAGLVAGAVGLSGATGASAAPALPDRLAAQLLADLAARTADPLPVVGTVRVSSDLGLPDVPDGHGEPLGPTALLSGEHDLRVWSDGEDRQKVALVSDLAEWSALRDDRDLWTWSSDRRTGAHLALPAHPAGGHDAAAKAAEHASTGVVPLTPLDAAEQALAAVDATTAVTVDTTATVAGRPAYTLVVEPRDETTLVGDVRISVDAETSTPLGVAVTAAGASEPALDVVFTDVSFRSPGDDAFTPPDADVVEVPVPSKDEAADGLARLQERLADGPAPQVVGSGWSRVLVVDAPAEPAAPATTDGEQGQADGAALLDRLSLRVPEGRALQTALVSVLLTDDGRLLVGSVPVEALRTAASPAS